MSGARRPKKSAPKSSRKRRTVPRRPAGHFVGRDPSPVLERYPPKNPELRGPPARVGIAPSTAPAAPAAAPPAPAAPLAPPSTLIRLDRPFDIDEFSNMLGETTVKVRVPREDLTEVLRRITDFMGFGVYVYSVTVRPAPSASLKEFEVELQRVDFATDRNRWEPFVERGASSPYDSTAP